MVYLYLTDSDLEEEWILITIELSRFDSGLIHIEHRYKGVDNGINLNLNYGWKDGRMEGKPCIVNYSTNQEY